MRQAAASSPRRVRRLHEGYKGHGVLTYAIIDALTTKAGAKGHEVDLPAGHAVDTGCPRSATACSVCVSAAQQDRRQFRLGVTTAALVSADAAADIPTEPALRQAGAGAPAGGCRCAGRADARAASQCASSSLVTGPWSPATARRWDMFQPPPLAKLR